MANYRVEIKPSLHGAYRMLVRQLIAVGYTEAQVRLEFDKIALSFYQFGKLKGALRSRKAGHVDVYHYRVLAYPIRFYLKGDRIIVDRIVP